MDNYNFKDCQSDIKSVIHLINLQGNNLIGLELGILRGESFCTVLQNCPNVKLLYGVDSWKPFTDFLIKDYDGKTPAYCIDEKKIETFKFIAYHNIKYSGHKYKTIILEKDHLEALEDIPNNYLDFIFLDNYLNFQDALETIEKWFPKVKNNGLFMGHDINCEPIFEALNIFLKKINYTKLISIFDNTWAIKK